MILVLALLKMTADLRIWNSGEPIFNIRGFNIRGKGLVLVVAGVKLSYSSSISERSSAYSETFAKKGIQARPQPQEQIGAASGAAARLMTLIASKRLPNTLQIIWFPGHTGLTRTSMPFWTRDLILGLWASGSALQQL